MKMSRSLTSAVIATLRLGCSFERLAVSYQPIAPAFLLRQTVLAGPRLKLVKCLSTSLVGATGGRPAYLAQWRQLVAPHATNVPRFAKSALNPSNSLTGLSEHRRLGPDVMCRRLAVRLAAGNLRTAGSV